MHSASQPYESDVVKRFEMQAEKVEVGDSEGATYTL
jgi:hypothetical protein